MKATRRFTVSVPAALLRAMDHRLVRGGESRSAVIRRLLEDALRPRTDDEAVEQYVRSYREQPQTEEEFGWLEEAVIDYAAHTTLR